jgi:hypothetical protein
MVDDAVTKSSTVGIVSFFPCRMDVESAPNLLLERHQSNPGEHSS